MVNFGQILLAQVLPEWRYVNYEALKTLIEEKASLSDFEEKLQAELFEGMRAPQATSCLRLLS